MSITRSVNPSVVVLGHVASVRELRSKADGRYYADEVVIEQSSGARLAVRAYVRDGTRAITPSLGEFVLYEVTVEESREYGTSLNYERPGAVVLDEYSAGRA